MAIGIGRRQFISALGGATVVWPLAARAQKADRMRRIGVLIPYAESDAEGQSRAAALQQGLEKRGWTIGRDVRIDYRWGIDNVERTQAAIAELLALSPDVILAGTSRTVVALQRATRTVPIVFTNIYEPVAKALFRASHIQAAILVASRWWRPRSERSGWGCSRRSHRISRASRSCSTRAILVRCNHTVRWKRPPRIMGWRR